MPIMTFENPNRVVPQKNEADLYQRGGQSAAPLSDHYQSIPMNRREFMTRSLAGAVGSLMMSRWAATGLAATRSACLRHQIAV